VRECTSRSPVCTRSEANIVVKQIAYYFRKSSQNPACSLDFPKTENEKRRERTALIGSGRSPCSKRTISIEISTVRVPMVSRGFEDHVSLTRTLAMVWKVYKIHIKAIAAKRTPADKAPSTPLLNLHIQCPKRSYNSNIERAKDDMLYSSRAPGFTGLPAPCQPDGGPCR
jgi:hypothetical protein